MWEGIYLAWTKPYMDRTPLDGLVMVLSVIALALIGGAIFYGFAYLCDCVDQNAQKAQHRR